MKPVTIGFTGTRSGISKEQEESLRQILFYFETQYGIKKVLHGGCIGADMDFHKICHLKERHVYPGFSAKEPEDLSNRGNYEDADVIKEANTHFARNRAIVDDCDILLACPYDDNKQGDTWYTINYALRTNKAVRIIYRNGEITNDTKTQVYYIGMGTDEELTTIYFHLCFKSVEESMFKPAQFAPVIGMELSHISKWAKENNVVCMIEDKHREGCYSITFKDNIPDNPIPTIEHNYLKLP